MSDAPMTTGFDMAQDYRDVCHELDKCKTRLAAEQTAHRATGAAITRLEAEIAALRRLVPLSAIEEAIRRATN